MLDIKVKWVRDLHYALMPNFYRIVIELLQKPQPRKVPHESLHW